MIKRFFWGLSVFFLPYVASGTSSLPENLVIKQQGDSLEGCLPDDYGKSIEIEEAFILLISKELQSSKAIIWSLKRLQGAKPKILKPGQCLIAGISLDGYQREGGIEWKLGESYLFSIERTDKQSLRMPGFFRANWSYKGWFCVGSFYGKNLIFLPYVNHPDGTTTYPRCGRYLKGPPAPDGIIPPPR